jgi:hypothetical protein
VHDSRPPDAADAGETVAAMGEERVDERPLSWPAAGWTTRSAGLSIDEEIAVIVDDAERDGLRSRFGRNGRSSR